MYVITKILQYNKFAQSGQFYKIQLEQFWDFQSIDHDRLEGLADMHECFINIIQVESPMSKA